MCYFNLMYLSKVWKHSRPLFFLVLVFIVLQLTVAYKQGMSVSPFYNTWMYSSPMPRADSIRALLVYSGGEPIKGSEFSQRDWDKVLVTYDYASSDSVNRFVYNEIGRISNKFHMPLPLSPYVQPASSYGPGGVFMDRWRSLVTRVTGKVVDSVQEVACRWDVQKLVSR